MLAIYCSESTIAFGSSLCSRSTFTRVCWDPCCFLVLGRVFRWKLKRVRLDWICILPVAYWLLLFFVRVRVLRWSWECWKRCYFWPFSSSSMVMKSYPDLRRIWLFLIWIGSSLYHVRRSFSCVWVGHFDCWESRLIFVVWGQIVRPSWCDWVGRVRVWSWRMKRVLLWFWKLKFCRGSVLCSPPAWKYWESIILQFQILIDERLSLWGVDAITDFELVEETEAPLVGWPEPSVGVDAPC